MRRLWVAMAVAGLVTLAVAAAAEECGVCHPQEKVAFADSIHELEEVGCTSCHGGDGGSRDADRAHRGDFRSLTNRGRIPAACASCHSDLDKMRAYNLPVDQFAVYQTSQHGRAVARGDTRAAVCTDCHEAHSIRPAEDPRSSIHPRNVPATCGRCHSDAVLMSRYGNDSGVVDEYLESVHGHALLIDGNAAAPNCNNCHGVHGATPPGVGDVDKICGACHAETRRAFLDGPHPEAMRAAGISECASCHSNHAIERFDLGATEVLCADCHGDESPQAELGRKMATLIEAAAKEIEKAETLATEGERMALHVEDYLGRVEQARTFLTEAPPLVHTVRLQPVEDVTRRAQSIAEEVEHEIYAKLDRRPARIGLVLFWFYLLLTLAILFSYRRRRASP